MMTRTTLLAVASLACLGLRPTRQDPTLAARVGAVKEVMNYRRFVLSDTSLFQTCDLTRALGIGVSATAFEPYQQAMLDQPAGCAPNSPLPRGRGAIEMSAIVVADSGVQVRLAIAHGEYFHLETYTVKTRANRRWVDSVLLSSGSQRELRDPDPGRRP